MHADRTEHGGEHRTAEPIDGETKRLSGLLTTALNRGCASKETMVGLTQQHKNQANRVVRGSEITIRLVGGR